MIAWKDIYEVFSVLVPLYLTMFLAYGSVRWWNIFTPHECAGINRFVAVFAVPVLSFHVIASGDLSAMNLRFIAADSIQKAVILVALLLWQGVGRRGSLDWTITLFSLSTLPNTLVVGIPLLTAMYGDFSGDLMVQIVELQSLVWYTLLLFLYEFREAKALVAEQDPPETSPPPTTAGADIDIEASGASPGGNPQNLPPGVTPRLMLIMVCWKLLRNPNTYASVLGVLWSVVAYRWKIQMPEIVKGCVSILSNTGLGMAMFSLGLFMALQPKILSCGKSATLFGMVARFLIGPAVTAAASIAIGIRGDLLRVSIIQAALPQGIVCFVFAKEYNCHADILSTAVIFGMLVALPITILYYFLLGLWGA